MPKLLLINGTQFGYSSGHYYYCKYLNNEYDIHYICYDRDLPKMMLPNVKVTYIPFNDSIIMRLSSFLKAAIKISRSLKPDVLFIVYFNAAVILNWFCKGKIKILDIRTGSLHNKKFKRNIDNFSITIQSFFFQKIIILSESLKNKLKIPTKKTLVLPLGAEVFFNGEHNYNNLSLLYIGALDGREIDKTILGLSIYLIKFPEKKQTTSYTIIGFGSEDEILKINKTITKTGLTGTVKYLGRKNYTELAPYLEEANIGVSFIPITEFYNSQPPTKTFEYILNGLFTIATNTYENRQLINKTNGLTCLDNAKSFANSLEEYQLIKHQLKSASIKATLSSFEWSILVKNKLLPFIK